MQLNMQISQRQEMRLAPRMIQSMEILQLPVMALEERLRQELGENPALELRETSVEEMQDEPGGIPEIESMPPTGSWRSRPICPARARPLLASSW